MVGNPIKRFHKSKTIVELDFGHIGLFEGEMTFGPWESVYRIRTKMRGGIFTTKPIPHGHALLIGAGVFPQHPQGIEIIPPCDKNSPGYQFFYKMPLMRMKMLEQDLEEANRIIEDLITVNMKQMSPEQIKENLTEIYDIFRKGKQAITGAIQENARMMNQPSVQM